MYNELFKNVKYPALLDTIDDLKIYSIPPWDFITDNYLSWKQDFEKAYLFDYAPFARMRNDDVIATFNLKSQSEEIYLFILPIFPSSKPFKKLDNINAWLKSVLEDSYEYLIQY
jgi:hypothetical protein